MYILLFLLPFLLLHAKIIILYLSIVGPPTTTMAIQWHTTLDQETSSLSWQTSDGNWLTKPSTTEKQENQIVHKVVLNHLTPNTEYTFRIGVIPKIYHFRTASEDPNEPFSFVIYAPKKEFPVSYQTIAQHILKREEDLFAKDEFYYCPPYPPTTPPISIDEFTYPFKYKDDIRDCCEKTRAAFQKIYAPDAFPIPLAKRAFTAASGDEEKKIFHADGGTDYGGIDKQDLFDTFHRQSVSFVAQVLQSFTDPDDFSLYATLHAIGLLKLRTSVKTETGDILQIGKWRAKAPSTSIYEDDPSEYTVVEALTPIPKESRYHRYYERMNAMLSAGVHPIYVRETLEGMEIPLSNLWDGGIQHTSAIHTVKILDYLEKKIRIILERGEIPTSVLLRDFALVHWWLAHLMPFFRGSASCIEILIQALAIAKNLPPPRLAGIPKDDPEHCFLFADLEAMYLPLEQFIDQYESLITRLTVP